MAICNVTDLVLADYPGNRQYISLDAAIPGPRRCDRNRRPARMAWRAAQR